MLRNGVYFGAADILQSPSGVSVFLGELGRERSCKSHLRLCVSFLPLVGFISFSVLLMPSIPLAAGRTLLPVILKSGLDQQLQQSPGDLLEMHILRPYSRPAVSKSL